MCGIAGIFDVANPPGMQDLRPMVDIQRHRGPDADGFLVDGPVAIGMRRLSIIDLSGGDQPIYNEDKSLAVVFNGEIYNYLELRELLLSKGHRFSTKSDTEVLVHLYEEEGPDFVSRLNGMFAFALWDRRQRSLLLSRDRMGVKPLYWARIGSRFLFASELKCLLTQSDLPPGFDQEAVADYLRLGYIPREATPYAGVRRLLPGHSLLLSAHGPHESRQWWNLADEEPRETRDPKAMQRCLEAYFDDAVGLRMRADVPVATFLSGGLDSSLVTIAAQRHTGIPINSFSLGFVHTDFDELPYARTVAIQAGTRHREVVASPQDALNHLPLLLWHMDEPMGDSSIIPNYLISRFAAEHVKVCLSGLGGDELFGGYARYLDPGMGRIRKAFTPFPAAAHMLAPLLNDVYYPWAEELRLASDPALAWRGYLHRLQIFDVPGLKKIGFPAAGRADETIESLWNQYPGQDSVSRRQFIDQHTYLPDEILALTDRMSMANSLEVRVPFMDYRLVRFSQRLGSPLKQNTKDFKIFLKQALGHWCPREILNRPKWGFDTPLGKWVSQPGIFRLLSTLSNGACVREGLLSGPRIQSLIASPSQARRFARRVWSLLVLEVWLRIRRRLTPPGESLAELLEARA